MVALERLLEEEEEKGEEEATCSMFSTRVRLFDTPQLCIAHNFIRPVMGGVGPSVR